jgi:hypothetical protein
MRDPFVLSVFESADLTVAKADKLIVITKDIRLKQKTLSTDMASF